MAFGRSKESIAKNDIVIVKLYNGEYIIGTAIENELSQGFIIEDAYSIAVTPKGISFIPLFVFTKVCITRAYINVDEVMYFYKGNDLDENIVNSYRSFISGIEIPNSKRIII